MSQAKIHDVRYRPYEGEIKGSTRRAVASMARWSALRALGARRPWTAKIVPVGLALVAFGPAITVLGMAVVIESLILWAGVSFKVSRSAQVVEPPAAEPFEPEFYDWLYE